MRENFGWLSRRQRAKNRQQKLMAEIAQSQRKFISQQNPDDHPMLVGTPPSLPNDHDSLEQHTASASANPFSMEQFIDYECCVCRTSKTDSQSPIGLIGTSCLSLCKSFSAEVLDELLTLRCSTESEIGALRRISTENIRIRFGHHDIGNVSGKNQTKSRANQWTSGKIKQSTKLLLKSYWSLLVHRQFLSKWPSSPFVIDPIVRTFHSCQLSFIVPASIASGRLSVRRPEHIHVLLSCHLEPRGSRSIEPKHASLEYELSLSIVPSIGECLDSTLRFNGLFRRSGASIRTDTFRSTTSSHASPNPAETSTRHWRLTWLFEECVRCFRNAMLMICVYWPS